MRLRFSILIFICCVFIITCFKNSYGTISRPKKDKLYQSLGLEFSGKLNFDLPIDADELHFSGDITLLNIKFKGDFNIRIQKKDPATVVVTSKFISADVVEIFNLLKKIGVKLNLPKEVTGNICLSGVFFKMHGNQYELKVNKISGPNYVQQKITIKNLNLSANSKKKSIILKIDSTNLKDNSIGQIDLSIANDLLVFKANGVHLNLATLSNLLFKIYPDIKHNILSKLKKIQNLYPVKDITAKGILALKDTELVLTGLNSRNINLTKFSAKIAANPTSLELYGNYKNPIILSLLTNCTYVNYLNNNIEVKSSDFQVNFLNLILKKNMPIIDASSIIIPGLSLNMEINAHFEHQDNSTCISLQSKLSSNKKIIIKTDRESILKIVFDPINIKIKNNKLDLLIQKFLVNIQKGIIKSHDMDLFINRGDIKITQTALKYGIQDKEFTVKSLLNIENTSFNYKNLTGIVYDMGMNILANNREIDLNNGNLKCQLNKKGSIELAFDTKIPLKNISSHLREIYKNTRLTLNIADLEQGDTKVEFFKVKKDLVNDSELEYSISIPAGKILGATQAKLSPSRFDLITRKLRFLSIQRKAEDKKINTERRFENKEIKPKVPETISSFSSHYHLEFDSLKYITHDNVYEISPLKGDILFKNHPSISFNGYFCNISFSGGIEFLDTGVSGIVDIRTISIPMDHLLGCFIRQAPVYITGDTNLQTTINFQGKTIKDLKENLWFDAFVDVEDGKILKLSNLGKKVGVILDVLSFVRLNPAKLEDSLEFSKFGLSLSGGLKEIKIKQLKLDSSLLNLYSYGDIDLKKNNMEIKGEIKKGFISKSFHLTEKLKKEKKESAP